MAGEVSIGVRILNKDVLFKALDEIPTTKAKIAFDRTRSDIAGRAPGWISKIAAHTYAVKSGILNPDSKAGKGSVHTSGSTLMDLVFHYSGPRLHVGSGATFKLKPSSHDSTPYQLQGQILRGSWSPYGHWSYPYSEGGKYGAVSPYMLRPGIGVPMQRHGKTFDKVAMGLAVPQMVVSERHDDEMMEMLTDRTTKQLIIRLNGVL